mmetsp:Transcript_32969/g.95139  ORF Transcript_32969/g.95139 Transcript_32969/m.95139 type:complete len:83 (+) Transcript_32969:621-869(+)
MIHPTVHTAKVSSRPHIHTNTHINITDTHTSATHRDIRSPTHVTDMPIMLTSPLHFRAIRPPPLDSRTRSCLCLDELLFDGV